MDDCGCEDCRRRREDAEDDGFMTGVVFAMYWHETHGAFPWESDRAHDRGHDGVHDDGLLDDLEDGFEDGFDDALDHDGW